MKLVLVRHGQSIYNLENKFTGFIFKIHANMDPKHRDRLAFVKIVSGNTSQIRKIALVK